MQLCAGLLVKKVMRLLLCIVCTRIPEQGSTKSYYVQILVVVPYLHSVKQKFTNHWCGGLSRDGDQASPVVGVLCCPVVIALAVSRVPADWRMWYVSRCRVQDRVCHKSAIVVLLLSSGMCLVISCT